VLTSRLRFLSALFQRQNKTTSAKIQAKPPGTVNPFRLIRHENTTQIAAIKKVNPTRIRTRGIKRQKISHAHVGSSPSANCQAKIPAWVKSISVSFVRAVIGRQANIVDTRKPFSFRRYVLTGEYRSKIIFRQNTPLVYFQQLVSV